MDMKLFLNYLQDIQKNNFEMTSSLNERRSKAFLSPRSLNENEGNPVSRRARDYPMDKPQSPPQPPLNEARKVNPNFAREVEETHIHVANAVTSVPGFQIPPEYPGYNNPEDPEHGSVMAHLKAVAPRLRNKVEAIKRVAKLHGVDPQAAIDALPSTAPMSLRDFMRALRR